MPLKPLVIYPDKRLSKKCDLVDEFSANLSRLLEDLFDTMLASEGLGLAAPQIGVLQHVAVIDTTVRSMPQPRFLTKQAIVMPEGRLELINPEIIASHGSVRSEEGCLSIPNYRESLKRNQVVTVEAFDRAGNKFKVQGEELLAFALQHEIDHLNGILFVDRLSRLKRSYFLQWLKKSSSKAED